MSGIAVAGARVAPRLAQLAAKAKDVYSKSESVASKAMTLFENQNAQGAQAALADIVTSAGGRDPSKLFANNSPKVQSALLASIFKNGLNPMSFARSGKATREELDQYASVMLAYTMRQEHNVDSVQAKQDTTGDPVADNDWTLLQLSAAMKILGIPAGKPEQLHLLITVFNTLRSSDFKKLAQRLTWDRTFLERPLENFPLIPVE